MNSKLHHQRLFEASQLLSSLASQQGTARRVVAAFILGAYLLTGLVSPDVFSDLRSPISIPVAHAAAGINPVINYQGKVSTLGGTAVANGSYSMRFKIYDAPTGGTLLWSETWSSSTQKVTMTGGLFSVALGTQVAMTGSVNFNTSNLYLQVEFDPGNDGVYEEVFSPRRQFGSVPYAHNADTLNGIDSSKFLRKDAVNVMTGSITVGGTLSGTIINASTSLTSSGTLTVKGAVRFKNYQTCALISTDASGNLGCASSVTASTGSVLAITNGRYVKKGGDTMTGALVINVTGGSQNTIGLNVINTASGAVFHAQKTLTSSGTLVTESGAIFDGGTLYVDAMGNRVGVGTTTPQNTLDVYQAGNASLGITGTNVAGITLYDGTGYGSINTYGDNTLRLSAAHNFGANQLVLLANGNIGVNTTTPKAKFTVVGSGAFTGTLSGSALNIQGGTSYVLGNTAIGKTTPSTALDVEGTISGSLLSMNGTGSSTFMNYKVGIGTTSPRSELHIKAAAGSDILTIESLNSATTGVDFMTQGVLRSSIHMATSTSDLVFRNDATGTKNNGFEFYNDFLSTTVPILHLDKGGNVGVGTTAPETKLEVAGTISGALITQNGAGNNYFLGNVGIGVASPLAILETKTAANNYGFYSTDGTVNSVIYNGSAEGSLRTYFGTANNYPLSFVTNGTLQMNIDNNGAVGIGTMSPKAKLTVAGSGAFTGTVSGSALNIQGGLSYILGNTAIGKTSATAKLDVEGTMSGTAIYASYKLTSSGTLTTRSGAYLNGNTLVVAGGPARVGIGITAPRTKLEVQGTISGSLITLNGPGNNYVWGSFGIDKTTPAATLDVGGTISGSSLKISNNISASGTLTIESKLKTGSAALTIQTQAYQTGAVIYGSGGAPALAISTYAQTGAGIKFGFRGIYDTELYRAGSLRTGSNSGGLVLRVQSKTSTTSAFKVISQVTSANNTVFNVTASGGVFTDAQYHSNGADYAEWFMSKDNLQPGEVVCIDVTHDNTVKRCDRDADSDVMGIISSKPGFVGNQITGAAGINPPGYVIVGLIGQVPAHVIIEGTGGTIQPGDALTAASKPGYARKARAGESTVGVALEAFSGAQGATGTVNVLISRRNSSMTVDAVGQKVLDTIAAMKIDDQVQLMVSSALGNLNVDQQITDEVTKQVDAIKAQNADITTLTADITRMEQEIALLQQQRSGTGSSTTTIITQTGSTFHHLAASSLELEDTLVTGGDARIGGNLTIDGTLNASSLFVPNGLTIDGGVTMKGLLDTQTLHVSSGAVVDGMMTINGGITFASGASLHFGSGALKIDQLIVQNALFVMGNITINGLATFLGDINVKGELTVSGKQAGFAMIPKSGTSVTIHFGTGFRAIPVVNATPQDFVFTAWRVTPATSTGFTIELAGPADRDVTFSWIAIGVSAPTILNANLAADGTIVFPMGSDNIPVSSNMAWNACIRNMTMLDSNGQPLSCDRYHDQFTWTQPDLNISFVWNTDVTPPMLKLPSGYETQVTENAKSIIDAINGGGSDGSDTTSGTGTTVTGTGADKVTTTPTSGTGSNTQPAMSATGTTTLTQQTNTGSTDPTPAAETSTTSGTGSTTDSGSGTVQP